MKKVLFCLSSLSLTNGIAAFVMNQYEKNLEHNIQFDFLLVKPIVDPDFRLRIEKNGGNIFIIKSSSKFKRYFEVKKFINKNILSKYNYDIVHINLVDIFALACVNAFKKNVKEIIYHVHNPKSKASFQFLRDLINKIIIKNSTKLYACSEHAGKSMFKNNKFTIVRNLIDLKKFKYNEINRKKIRDELNINDDNFVFGVVGRITDQKNPYLIIDFFKKISGNNKSSSLLWVGDGDLKENVIQYVYNNNIDNTYFIGEVKNVEDYYSSFDAFILLSKYEGMGIVFVEAQASGLITFASENVPIDVFETKLIHTINTTKMEKSYLVVQDSLKELTKDRVYWNSYLQKNSKFSTENLENYLYNLY